MISMNHNCYLHHNYWIKLNITIIIKDNQSIIWNIFIYLLLILHFGSLSANCDSNAQEKPETIIKNIIKKQLERHNHHGHQQHNHHRHQMHQLFNNNDDHDYNGFGLYSDVSTNMPSHTKTTTTATTTTMIIPIDKQQSKIDNEFHNSKLAEKLQIIATSMNKQHIVNSSILNNSSSSSSFNVDSFLPQGYDKLMPPKQNGKPTKVRFHVWVLGLDSIDEGSMTYVADIFMSQSWKDNRLIIPKDIVFNVNASNDPRGPYRLLPLTFIDKIWRPDSFFKNTKEVTFQEMTIPNHYIWLYSDNTILYMVKLTLLLSCAMKFQTYPHDIQNCTMKIESLSYTTNDLIFDWEESDPLVVEEHIELPQHDLIKKDIDDCTTNYSSGTFACVQVIFTIKRRLGYYIFHTYIPTCLIVIMSWISFWIKPEAVPARVTLCVTSLLTLSTQHAQSQKSLPPVSYIKAIDIFMSSCTVFVFASLMEYALVNILMADEILNGGLNWFFDTSNNNNNNNRSNNSSLSNNDAQKSTHRRILNRSKSKSNESKSNINVNYNQTNNHHNESIKKCLLSNRSFSLTKLNDDSIVNNNNNNQLNSNSMIYSNKLNQKSSNIRHRIGSILNDNSSMMIKTKISNQSNDDFDNNDKDNENINNDNNDDEDEDDEESIHNYNYSNYKFKRCYNNDSNLQYNLDQSINQFLIQSKHRRAYTVDHISRWIFPLSFLMLNVIYWAYYLNVGYE